MEKPQIRQIESQRVESEREITGSEAEEILRKYGHQQTNFSTKPIEQQSSNNDLTFEQMVELEEKKLRQQEEIRKAKLYGPKPTTFDGRNGYESEVKYGSDDELGFGFKIEITTDMNLPKY